MFIFRHCVFILYVAEQASNKKENLFSKICAAVHLSKLVEQASTFETSLMGRRIVIVDYSVKRQSDKCMLVFAVVQ